MDEGLKKILEDSAFFWNLCLLLETLLLSKLSLELRKRKCQPYKAQIKTASCPITGVLDRTGRKILFWRSEDK
jgi:hypothetical protein